MMIPVPLFGFPGGFEVLLLVLLAVVLFGASKIPELARSTGQAMGEFEKGKEKAEKELQEMRENDFEEGEEASDAEELEETKGDVEKNE